MIIKCNPLYFNRNTHSNITVLKVNAKRLVLRGENMRVVCAMADLLRIVAFDSISGPSAGL